MPIDEEALYASLLGNEDPDTLGLVLNHFELSRQAIEWLMHREVENKAGTYIIATTSPTIVSSAAGAAVRSVSGSAASVFR